MLFRSDKIRFDEHCLRFVGKKNGFGKWHLQSATDPQNLATKDTHTVPVCKAQLEWKSQFLGQPAERTWGFFFVFLKCLGEVRWRGGGGCNRGSYYELFLPFPLTRLCRWITLKILLTLAFFEKSAIYTKCKKKNHISANIEDLFDRFSLLESSTVLVFYSRRKMFA